MALTKITIPSTVTALTTTQYNAIQTNIDYILGQGEGDYGYGQDFASNAIESGATLTTTTYNDLAAKIRRARVHQTGTSGTSLIPELRSGASVTSSYIQKLVTQVNLADTNRLVIPPVGANSTITEIASQSTTEVQEWNGVTTHLVEVEFETVENMRYFFNTGGQIQFLASRVTKAAVSKNVSVPKNTSWTSLLKGIGTINFSRTKTTSTSKVGGTLIGFANLFDFEGIPTEGKVIFQKYATESAFKLNSYTITAGISPDSSTAIQFSIEFNDASVSTPELNVGGSLSSIVKAYRATGVNVEVPLPTVNVSDMFLGLGAPTYTIDRTPLVINETDTSGADFTVTTTNLDDNTQLYWTISGTNITEKDFDLDTMGITAITNVPFEIVDNTSETISVIAAADAVKEGLEKFNFIVTTSTASNALPVAKLPLLSLEKINDTSLPVQVVPVTAFYFESQSVTSFKEGTAATFVIGAANVKVSTVVYWELDYGDGDISALDFANSTDNGNFTFPSGRTKYSLSIKLTGKDGQDPGESFKVRIYTVVDGLNKYHDTSARIDIIDDYVAAPVIPEPSITITGNISSIEEGSSSGVEFTVSVPAMATNSKLYWKAVSDSGTTLLKDEDFSKTYIVGGYGKGGTATSFVVVQANKRATLKRFAAKDTETEGIESFTVEFYSDPLYQNFVIASAPISITETVGHSITSTPTSAVEGGPTGIRFNVSTPYMSTGKLWWTIQLTGGLSGEDFDAVTDFFLIDDSKGYFDVFPKKDNVIEGDQLFQVDVRTESAAGPIKITGKGTITEDPLAYSIDAVTTVAEGGSVTYNITTPYTTSGFLYWTVSSVTGSVTDLDFLETDHKISINNSQGSFTLHPKSDNSTEGSESFKIVLRKSSTNGTVVYTQPEPVYITEIVDYTIALQNGVTSVTEGGNVIVKITTQYTAANTPLFWEIRPVAGDFKETDITVVDFESTTATSKFNGQVRTALVTTNNITVSQASFTIFLKTDTLTEGTETFKIYLKDSSTGQPIKETGVISLTELVPWSLLTYDPETLAAKTEVNEGNSIKFVIKTPYRPNNTALYWKAVSGGMGSTNFTTTTGTGQDLEFTPMSGIVYTTGNETSIVVSPTADKFTEGNVNFKIRIYELPSTMSTIDINALNYTSVISESNFRIESYPVMIVDTSETPPVPEVLPPKILSVVPYQNSQEVTSILEGSGGFSYVVTSENIAAGETLYWNLITVNVFTGNILPGTSGTATVGAGGITPITFTSVLDNEHNGNKTIVMAVRLTQFATKSSNGNALTIIKEQTFTVTPAPLTVKEGSDISFTITTPSASANSNLVWTIEPYANSTITASDFIDKATGNPLSTLSGTVPINSKGIGVVTLQINSDGATEGAEQFTVSLKTSGLAAIALGTPCPPVTITEDVGYTITANNPFIVEAGGATTGRVTFTVTTPRMSQATTILKYKVEQFEGNIRNTDFEEFASFGPNDQLVKSFEVTSNNGQYSGSFDLTARADGQIEGNDKDKFKIKLFNVNMVPIDATMSPISISIREESSYSVSLTAPGVTTPAPSSVLEKTKVTFYVSAPQNDGTKLYWQAIAGDVATSLTPADFSELAGKTAMSGFSYVYGNQTTVSLTPQFGNKTFKIQISDTAETGPFLPVTAPTVTVTQAQTFSVVGAPEKVFEGQAVTFVITHPAVANNTMYWKLVGTAGAEIAATDFKLNGIDLTLLSGINTNMTAGGGQTSMVFSIKQDSTPELLKKFTLKVGTTDSPFTAVTNGTSNEISFTDAGSFVLRADKTTVSAGETVTFHLKVSPTTTVKNIYWKIPTAYVSYFNSTIEPGVSGTVALSSKDTNGEIPIKLTLAKLFTTSITTDISVSLEIKEETESGAVIIPTPNPSVSITGDYSISPNTATIVNNGTAITFTAPSSVNTLYWKLDDTTKGSWFVGGATSGSRVKANGAFPALTMMPSAAGKNGKTFQITISDQDSGTAKLTSGLYTMPAEVAIPPTPTPTNPTPTTTTTTSGNTVVLAPVLTIVQNPKSIAVGMTADFIVSTPTPTPIALDYVIKGDPEVLKALKNTSGSAISSGNVKISPTNTVPTSFKKELGIGYHMLSISLPTAPALATLSVGYFWVEYTLTGANPVATENVYIAADPKTYTFYKSGKLKIPTGVTEVSVLMQGAGGQGGGMSNAYGGNGGNGDKISGILTIPEGSTELKFNIVNGGGLFSTAASTYMGPGGQGGAGVELFIDDQHVATAAGGGGAGGGGPLPYPVMYPYTLQPGVESVLNGTPTSKSNVRNSSAGAIATGDGAGAGGYPGGTSGLSTRTASQQVYYNNNNSSRTDTYATLATGGSGGVSTIASGHALTLIGATIASTTVTYNATPANSWSATNVFMNSYAIWTDGPTNQITARFDSVNLNTTASPQVYVLTAGGDDTSWFIINNKTYKVDGWRGKEVEITLDNSWNRSIIAYAKNKDAYGAPGKNPYGVAGTIALKTSKTTILWHTRMPATVVGVEGQTGGGGKGGRGVASSSIPPNVTTITPYTGGIAGVPRVNTGEMGEPAFISFTIQPVTGLQPSGYKNFTANGTWVVPDGVTLISVIVVGGGGGGGAGYDDTSNDRGASGGGGGAGGYVSCDVSVTPGQSISVTVGIGGVAGYSDITKDTTVSLKRQGGQGGTSSIVFGSSSVRITAIGGQGGRGYNQDNTKVVATKQSTTGGESGYGTVPIGSGSPVVVESVVIPKLNNGQAGVVDAGVIDLAFSLTAKQDVYYLEGGNGASNNTKYGQGGRGGSTNETTKVNTGKAGGNGIVSIYYGTSISGYTAPAALTVTAAAAVKTAAATIPYVPPAVDTITYSAHSPNATGLGKYWAYAPVGTLVMYWENLNIPVTAGMTITTLGYEQYGTFTLFNSRGSTYTVPGQLNTPTWNIPSDFGIIVKIQIDRINQAFATGYISDAKGMVWTTLSSADHFRTPQTITPIPPVIHYVNYVQHSPGVATTNINHYGAYRKVPYNSLPIGSLYWENLNITVASGMTLQGLGLNYTPTTFVLTNTVGTTVTITGDNTTRPIPSDFGTIVKVEVVNALAWAAGYIVNGGGSILWSTLDIAQHNA